MSRCYEIEPLTEAEDFNPVDGVLGNPILKAAAPTPALAHYHGICTKCGLLTRSTAMGRGECYTVTCRCDYMMLLRRVPMADALETK